MSMELMVKAMNAKVGNALRKLVLLKLADNANDKGECWPSHQHVADQCEISRSSVRKHIADLEAAGYLTIKARKTDLGTASNLYKLQFPPKPTAVDPMPADDTPMPADDTGGCREKAGAIAGAGTPPMPAAGTRTSHSFEPVNEPLKDLSATRTKSTKPTATAKGKNAGLDFSPWPAEPSSQVLQDWLAVRKAKKAPFTQTVINRLAKHLHQAAQHGLSVDECLSECAVRGWVGFEFAWLVNAGVLQGKVLAIPDHGTPQTSVDDGFPAWEGE